MGTASPAGATSPRGGSPLPPRCAPPPSGGGANSPQATTTGAYSAARAALSPEAHSPIHSPGYAAVRGTRPSPGNGGGPAGSGGAAASGPRRIKVASGPSTPLPFGPGAAGASGGGGIKPICMKRGPSHEGAIASESSEGVGAGGGAGGVAAIGRGALYPVLLATDEGEGRGAATTDATAADDDDATAADDDAAAAAASDELQSPPSSLRAPAHPHPRSPDSREHAYDLL